ncbi:MAG: hypothetical protein F4X42_16005 [Rhodospirillaceae bacterium]|nr:hypothetical protein [Rhodospirillaceae bacterium]
MTAYFIVRAEVEPDARDAFDRWYETEHLPDAVAALGAAGASRGWSGVEDNVHVAFYEFADMAAVQRMMASDALKGMIAEFSRHWDGKVTRTRDAVELIQKI